MRSNALLCSRSARPFQYGRVLVLLRRFAPLYVHHYARRPFRPPAALAPSIRPRRHREAFYDGLLNLFIDGYAEIMGLSPKLETGQVIVRFNRLLSVIDDALDERLRAADVVPFADLLDGPVVQERLQEWRQFAGQLGIDADLTRFFKGEIEAHFSHYLGLISAYRASGDYATLRESVNLDSGGQLRTLAHILSVLHGHAPSDTLLREFHAVGVIGKFVDDMIDIALDMNRGQTNLLYALVSQQRHEHDMLQQAIDSRVRLSGIWWRRNCPITAGGYCRDIHAYFHQIESSKLRLACEIMMIPALLGRGYSSL